MEYLYDAWRSVDRFIIYASTVYEMGTRPYQAFSETIENLTHLVRQTYRNIQENITGKHPVVYRQVRAGAEIAAITSSKLPVRLPDGYEKLHNIPLIRQILLYPPLILNPPMNKRTGKFVKIDVNPLNVIQLHDETRSMAISWGISQDRVKKSKGSYTSHYWRYWSREVGNTGSL